MTLEEFKQKYIKPATLVDLSEGAVNITDADTLRDAAKTYMEARSAVIACRDTGSNRIEDHWNAFYAFWKELQLVGMRGEG